MAARAAGGALAGARNGPPQPLMAMAAQRSLIGFRPQKGLPSAIGPFVGPHKAKLPSQRRSSAHLKLPVRARADDGEGKPPHRLPFSQRKDSSGAAPRGRPAVHSLLQPTRTTASSPASTPSVVVSSPYEWFGTCREPRRSHATERLLSHCFTEVSINDAGFKDVPKPGNSAGRGC